MERREDDSYPSGLSCIDKALNLSICRVGHVFVGMSVKKPADSRVASSYDALILLVCNAVSLGARKGSVLR